MLTTPEEADLSNRYDKIMKENQDEALPGIIKHVLGINIVKKEVLTSKLQQTKEREADRLTKVTDGSGKTYILNIEWQSRNDANMLSRMLEYRVMARRKYQLPVKQYVLYMGSEKLTMKDCIDEEDLQYRYRIVSLSEIDYKFFLKSNKPEQKVLAVLGEFGKDSAEQVIGQILTGIRTEAESDLSKNKYFNQLRILAQLRNLVEQFNTAMESVSTFFKEEKDPLYRKGIVRGIEKERAKAEREKKDEKLAIAREFKKLGVAVADIAKGTGLPIAEIEKL
ncbi:putative transposase/invertase (TIGR01784 family) [Arcticibacter tournemirensis]|uniref:Rpn family recombination-promoting nuclease/putative transposase n=1 Tax=Arcticibacter tournemirensis TaxID=699437 RepID=A0A5M9HKP9_9SPHI|nr:Rpn family recombination-promoting nuclease/putative transposase [Arcticibacter tournemirensis]KAA8486843.1 Rpn family recombination-promoting nuclease/putative transposase [Arcticibacter tournemirensis]TQM49393.1 putative transposase/invertase (TIGR01784 family) [Arcticibacter tournemirensis]